MDNVNKQLSYRLIVGLELVVLELVVGHHMKLVGLGLVVEQRMKLVVLELV